MSCNMQGYALPLWWAFYKAYKRAFIIASCSWYHPFWLRQHNITYKPILSEKDTTWFLGLIKWTTIQIAKFMGPTLGPPASFRTPMVLASWTLLSGLQTSYGCLLSVYCSDMSYAFHNGIALYYTVRDGWYFRDTWYLTLLKVTFIAYTFLLWWW